MQPFDGEFDDEVDVNLLRVEFLHEVVCCAHAAAGSEQIVVNEHDIVFRDGILVNLDSVFAILFRVRLFHGFCR